MGTGSAIAHRAVDSMMGPRETTVVHQNAPAAPAAAPMVGMGNKLITVCGRSFSLKIICLLVLTFILIQDFFILTSPILIRILLTFVLVHKFLLSARVGLL